MENIDIDIDIDKDILENIDINIDKEILENIDIDIDKDILENIDIVQNPIIFTYFQPILVFFPLFCWWNIKYLYR